jgi:hypothetical protein
MDVQITLWVNDLRREGTSWRQGRSPEELRELVRARTLSMIKRMLSHDGVEAMVSAVEIKETK